MREPSLCVFAGPSLPAEDRSPMGGVEYRAPAARNDITRAAAEHTHLLLIDGVFDSGFAPSPIEFARACRRSHVFGAASMGALRAAECRPYGAVALGAIAGWYARGVIDGDDEVAVLMHPHSHVALTVPSVNVRYVSWLARRRGILSAAQAASWAHAARLEIFYADRTWDDALALAPASARPALRVVAEREGDLKRWDARFALRRALRSLERAQYARA